MRVWTLAVALGVAGLLLGGCSDVSEAFGAVKESPDEFAVMPKAPLVMPPDYNLRPPAAGSRAANMPDPEDQARQSLYPNSTDAAAASLGNTYSDSEKRLLAQAHAANADPSIRSRIAADAGYEDEGSGFADKVMFWQDSNGPTTAKDVDAKAEADRLRKAQATGQNPAPATDTSNGTTSSGTPSQ